MTNVPLETCFVRALLQWHTKSNDRAMPWKGEKDPYKIWISEIILQQTRVDQGLNYFNRFIAAFPDINSLATAPDDKVFKLWEGLGYYSRCKNLIATAKIINGEYSGVFPKSYEAILKLKGIGPYTAAAIASFAFNLHHAVVDGNVFRVYSRIFLIDTPIDTAQGKKKFTDLAQQLLPKKDAGIYNQAVMDFGAVICKPVPDCSICFYRKRCKAFKSGVQQQLPIKEKKIIIRSRFLNYAIIRYKDEVAVQQRREKDIWQNLYQFPSIETDEAIPYEEIFKLFKEKYQIKSITETSNLECFVQKLTHRKVHFSFLTMHVNEKPYLPTFEWLHLEDVHKYAFPKSLKQYLQKLI